MQSSLALCICLFIAVSCAAYTEREYQGAFAAWQQQHQRAYTANEFAARYGIFKQTMDYIHQHNSEGHSFTLGLNHFSDLTNAEYKSLLYPIEAIPASLNLEQHTGEGHTARATSVDWRTSGAVQAIKNQGQCGSCWTFATAASIESITKIATGTLPNLSEQNLLDCTPQGNSGCNGGVPYYATTYVINNHGIDTEASYPYQTAQGSCRYNAANVGATISGVVQVTRGSESALQSAVAQQPVSVAIDASHPSFQSYKSGVYSEAACSSTSLDHAVLVVGYNTDATQGDYWIVKNSWGTYWGQSGYFWLARNANNKCGVATSALYPKH